MILLLVDIPAIGECLGGVDVPMFKNWRLAKVVVEPSESGSGIKVGVATVEVRHWNSACMGDGEWEWSVGCKENSVAVNRSFKYACVARELL